MRGLVFLAALPANIRAIAGSRIFKQVLRKYFIEKSFYHVNEATVKQNE